MADKDFHFAAPATGVADYNYTDENGEILFQVLRREPKDFRQRSPDGRGGWVWGVKGVRQVPYRLPDLIAAPDADVYVVEGEKDADRLVSLGLVATCNSGGAGKWQHCHAEHLAGRAVVIIPDNDTAGQAHAERVRQSLREIAQSVRILELGGLPPKGDVSDWLDAGGTVTELQRLAMRTANDESPPRDHCGGFVFADEMVRDLGPTRWLVQKLIPEECTAVLYGQSGSLKSFVMLDIALSIANGVAWQGKPTKARTVYYLAGEGRQGFAKRIEAWCQDRELAPPPGFAFRAVPRLQDIAQLEHLIEAIRAIEAERGQAGLIVIDTLFTALGGGDENSGKDMGQLIAAMTRIREEFGAAVVAVHHTGKQGDSARGHSSLPSGMDVMLYAKQGPSSLSVEITNPKQKDYAQHPALLLQAVVRELPIAGEDGELETSLVLHNATGAILEGYQIKTKRAEVRAQEVRHKRKEAERRIKTHAVERFADAATLGAVEREVEELARQLGFPELSRGKSTLSTWRKEAGL